MLWRVRQGVALQLPRLPEAHRFTFQRRSLLSPAAVESHAGATQSFRRPSANGFAVTFHSCAICGSNLWWEPERMPHLVGVAVGAFADPDFPMPKQAVWTEEMHSWIRLPEAMAAYARNPPPKAAVRDDPAPE